MTTVRYAILSSLLAATGCTTIDAPEPEVASGARPLIGGTVDGDDPGVVALLSSGSTSAFCTGTLVSPSVVLTAAHCVDMFSADPSAAIFFGADTGGSGTRISVTDKVQDLGWTGSLGNHDIAMLLLQFPQDPDFIVPMNNVSPLSDEIGSAYRHTGFGVYENGADADGKKRTGTTTISGVSGSGDVVYSGDDDVTICYGDSGGPGMITVDGIEYVAGIHSSTTTSGPDNDCVPPAADTRVDMYADDFVLPWIQEHDPACSEDGLCARVGCTEDPDCEPCGPDGTCTDSCALPDPDCATSGMGEICQADTQCESGLCVYWRDDVNYKFCTTPCDGGCPDGMSCQDVSPFGEVCYFDEPPPGVLGDDCDDALDCGSYICEDDACVTKCDLSMNLGCPPDFECKASGDDYYCVSTDSGGGGGCATTTGRGAITPILFAIGLLALLLRRRRPAVIRR
jgi:hypothetical protein